MTRLGISCLFAGLLALSGSAWAQGHDEHKDRGKGGQAAQQAAQPAPQAAQPERPQIGGRFGHGYNPGAAAQNTPAPPPAAGPDRRDRQDQRTGAQNTPPPTTALNNDRRGFNNDTRGPDRGFGRRDTGGQNAMRGPDTAMRAPNRDFRSLQRNFTAPQRFHVAVYNRPRGWYPHRWVFGEILPSLFWTSEFWLTDYYYYGLEPPPPGTIWVRDGFDALLIDRYDGEIIEVAYNVFF